MLKEGVVRGGKRVFAVLAVSAVLAGFPVQAYAGDVDYTVQTFDGAGEPVTEVLNTLQVRDQTYEKSDRSKHDWNHVDGMASSYNTRDYVLARDMADVSYKYNGRVASGILRDPYTGAVIYFEVGTGASRDGGVQIEHTVAYSEAYNSGLGDMPFDVRDRYYNDPYVLLASDSVANQDKSDSDAAQWLPSNEGFRCEYVARQIGVKAKYGLSVDQAEKSAMEDVLATCPTQTVPNRDGVVDTGTVFGGDDEKDSSGKSGNAGDEFVGWLKGLWGKVKEALRGILC